MRPIRAAGITTRQDKVLLMWRHNHGREYYIFPGGRVEKGETVEEAVRRELKEETSIEVEVENLLYHLRYSKNGQAHSDQYFYLCRYISGRPKLGDFNEKKRMEGGKDLYKPMWISLEGLGGMTVYPAEIRDWLTADVGDGFSQTPREGVLKIETLRNE